MYEIDPYTLEDIDFNDKALNDFMSRFGDLDPNKNMVQNKFKSKNAIQTSQQLQDKGFGVLGEQGLDVYNNQGIGTGSPGQGIGSTETDQERRQNRRQDRLSNRIDRAADRGATQEKLDKLSGKLENEKGEGLLATKKIGVGDYGSLGMEALDVVDTLKGNKFDSDAESGGPGKSGAIGKGVKTFATVTAATGNPFIGGLAGAGVLAVTALKHQQANRKFYDNRKKFNKSGDKLLEAEREEELARSEGLLSMNTLKGLRQKQLGIFNT